MGKISESKITKGNIHAWLGEQQEAPEIVPTGAELYLDDEDDDDYKSFSDTFDISFIEFAIINKYLYSVYRTANPPLTIDSYGYTDDIGRVNFGSAFDSANSFWFRGEFEGDTNEYSFHTKIFQDSSQQVCTQLHISVKVGLATSALFKKFEEIKKLAFNNSEYTGKCIKVKLKENRFKGIEIIEFEDINTELTLTEIQNKYIDNFISRVSRGRSARYLFNGEPGTGKAQPLDSKVLTPNGWTTMGEIKVGDEVITPNGKISKVSGVYPQGFKDIYKISFKDGRHAEACGEHLWKVYGIQVGKKRKRSWKILSTLDIKNKLENGGYKNKLKLPLVSENINYNKDIDFIVDPYLMGVLLGDETFNDTNIKLTSADSQIINEVKELIPEDYNILFSSKYDYVITRKEGKGYKGNEMGNKLVQEIRKFNLSDKKAHNKFIPEKYKIGSLNQKLSLLQGLMDSDGTVDKSSHLSFSTTSYQLAKDVQEMIWSIGGIATIKEKKTFYTHNGVRKSGRLSYNLGIRYHSPKNLFRLTRKKDRISDSYQYSDTLKNNITSIELIGKKEAQCIMINDENHLYITDNYIVTHNTESIRRIIKQLIPHVTFIIPDFATSEDLTVIMEACEIFNKGVIIMDDIDLYLGSRDKGNYTKLLGEFLSFFDGVKKRKISLLGSTNDKGLVDKAAERPGRFNMTIDFSFLTSEQIVKVCQTHLPEIYHVQEVYDALQANIGGKKANITGAFIANLAENIKEMAEDNELWSVNDTIELITESYKGFYLSQLEKNKSHSGFKID